MFLKNSFAKQEHLFLKDIFLFTLHLYSEIMFWSLKCNFILNERNKITETRVCHRIRDVTLQHSYF